MTWTEDRSTFLIWTDDGSGGPTIDIPTLDDEDDDYIVHDMEDYAGNNSTRWSKQARERALASTG